MFFEGSEKKVEVVFDERTASLRRFPAAFWERVVARSRAAILSKIANPACDAYLLSESSLFVYDYRLIMITCGTTALTGAIAEMFTFLEPGSVRLLVYERKNELCPEDQPSDFNADAAFLHRRFPGSAFVFGGEEENHVRVFYHAKDFDPPADDMTLEILMHGLSLSARGLFAGEDMNREKIYRETGIHRFWAGFTADDYLFTPMGYSLNGICGDSYYTVHVTPQDPCSYASFETNRFFHGDLEATVARVCGIFQPENFSVVLYSRHADPPALTLGNYGLNHYENRSMCGYEVRFFNFDRQENGSRSA